jgi:hypothetical protein
MTKGVSVKTASELLGSLLDTESGDYIFLRNVGLLKIYHVTSCNYLPNSSSRTSPEVHSAPNKIEDQKQKETTSGSRAQLVREADNLTAICELIVYTIWDPSLITIL